jgi:hypothetical protein
MSNPEGMAIARARIAEEKEKRTGFLDLGKLGLTEWPEGLWELGHLTGLNLGSEWVDEEGERHEADGNAGINRFTSAAADWKRLPNLRLLSMRDLWWDFLDPLAGLASASEPRLLLHGGE